MRVLILEDEPLAAQDLVACLLELPYQIEVIAVLPSVKETVDWLKNNPAPDLIFSDIHLQDGKSFAVFQQVSVQAPVIFCTAYDQYALEAFQTQGIDYLLKPVAQKDLERCFQKIQDLRQSGFLSGPQLKTAYRKTLLAYLRQEIIPLQVASISYIEYKRGNTRIYTDDSKFEFRATLESLQEELNPNHFFRANRQIIVQRQAIEKAEQSSGRKLTVHLRGMPVKISVSKEKATQFLKWLEAETS